MENNGNNITAVSLSLSSASVEKIMFTGSSLFLFITAIVNFLAHIVIGSMFLKSRSFRQSRHIYIFSVALADFLSGMTIPLSILETMNSGWTLDPYLCPIFLVTRHSMLLVSLLSVLLFTLDRWWSITFPLSYRARQSRHKSIIVLIIVWIFAGIVHVPTSFVWNSQYIDNGYKIKHCLYPYNFDRVYAMSLTVIEFSLPIFFLLVLNTSIYVVLTRRRNATELRRSLSTNERAVRSRINNQSSCLPNCNCASKRCENKEPRPLKHAKNHSSSELPAQTATENARNRSRSVDVGSTVSCQYSFSRKESDNLVRDFLLRQGMRAVFSVGILTMVAILFRLPYVIASLLDVFSFPVPSVTLLFLQNLTVINTMVNPFLYKLGNKNIKKTLEICIASKLEKTDKLGIKLTSMYSILDRNGKVSNILRA